jgi:protein SCO1/2
VAVTFIYTRCPLPDYCVRLSNNLGVLQRRFKKEMGSDLILLTIIIDPIHDQPETLSNYARTWKADARTWHFLTGSVSDIRQLCHKFDMDFYPDEALLVHSFHTVVIDRSGELAANLEGNTFTSHQLGDLVQTVMARSPTSP